MAVLTGSDSDAVFVLSTIATNYGTATAATASEDRLVCESVGIEETVTELELNSIGAGTLVSTDADRGSVAAAASINMKGGYHNAFAKICAQFFGTSGTPTEQNGGEGDYLHRMTLNSDHTNIHASIAYESSTTTVKEIPSATCTDLAITWRPLDYLDCTASFLGDEVELSTSVNTNAVVGASGEEDTERIVVQDTDEFLINAQGGGALTSPTDRLDVAEAVFNFTRPQSFVQEINGTAGNSAPIRDGLATGTLTVTLKNSNNHTYEDAAQAGTEYKASIRAEGTQIGSGDNKKVEIFIPRMKLLPIPQYNLDSPGENQKILVFKILSASANPTDMDDHDFYVEFINEKSDAYVA